MAETREREIIEAFVQLSEELVDDYDVVDMLARLTVSCTDLLDVGSAGLLLADDRGSLQLAASSSERTRDLELYQLQRDQGPCLDCFRTGQPVSAVDLDLEGHRWPAFAAAAGDAGFRSVHALPMRIRDEVLGALGLFGDRPGALLDDDVSLAQALAHVASVAVVNERTAVDRADLNVQLQGALDSRVVVEQAKGILAQAGDLDMATAFAVLRRYSRDHGRKLGLVAAELARRELTARTLLDHARGVSLID